MNPAELPLECPPTRRAMLQGLAGVPLGLALPRFGFGGDSGPAGGQKSDRGLAFALGEEADASSLPPARRPGEHLALALAGSARPLAGELARVAGSSEVEWIELSPFDQGKVDFGPLAERVRTAASVALIEGPVLEWLVTLWPARRTSAVLRALAECAVTGGRLIGRGSTSFLLAGGGVARGPTATEIGESRLRLSNPRESGEARRTQGLRLCGEALIDTQVRAGGSILRLLSTMIEQHEDQGLLLAPRSVLCGDIEARTWTSLGGEPLLLLDLGRARRLKRSVEGARVSVLAAGDGWRYRDRSLAATGSPADFGPALAGVEVEDALSAAAWRADPRDTRELRDQRARVELVRDGDSRAYQGPGQAPLRAHALSLSVRLARGSWGELESGR